MIDRLPQSANIFILDPMWQYVGDKEKRFILSLHRTCYVNTLSGFCHFIGVGQL